MRDKIIQAIDRRKPLHSITNAMRLINGKGDDCEGLIIDQFGSQAVIYLYQNRWVPFLNLIKEILLQYTSFDLIVVKDRTENVSSKPEHVKTTILFGTSSSNACVNEYGLSFQVELMEGLNSGLFLDMRANRHDLGSLCKNKKVLNCFAYTCAFGVHARAHGAREVVNVDLSKPYLQRGQVNYALNALLPGKSEFLRFDAVRFLTNCVKKGNLFDVIIVDPPSFARNGTKTFQVKRDLPHLIALALATLEPKGMLFVSTNCSDLTHAHLESMVAHGLNKKKVISITRVGQDIDFTKTNTFKESYLVGLSVKVA